MKTIRIIFALLIAAAVLRIAPAGAGSDTNTNAPAKPVGLADLLTDQIVARGKDVEIKRSRVDQGIVDAKASIAASGRQLGPNDIPRLEMQVLDSLILTRMLNNKATAEEKAKGKEESDRQFELIRKEFPSEDAMTRQFEAMGETPEKVRTALTEQAVVNMTLSAKAKVADADVRKFYDDQPSLFEHPERVRASHILIMTVKPDDLSPLPEDQIKAKRKLIDDLRKRAADGEDFAKLAKEYTDDPGSKDKGGEYIFGRGEMDPAFEAAAFALKTNEISEVVTSRYGFHIIKLSERVAAGKSPFEDVKASIRKHLEGIEIQKFLPQYYVELKKEAGVEILDEKLKVLEDAATARASQADPSKDVKPKDGGK